MSRGKVNMGLMMFGVLEYWKNGVTNGGICNYGGIL
jgi:hypothetical protein